jgi:DNA-directed RNA polymerase specialized sigma24 family protein
VVLVLRYTDDLSLESIARLTDLPVGTVKSRLSRASDAVRLDLARRGHPFALAHTTAADDNGVHS